MNIPELVNSHPPMTKAEFVERLARDPIVIEPVAKLRYYRIALHGDDDPTRGVVIGIGPGGVTWLADDYQHAYARVGGRTLRLTYREAELIAARLRRIFGESHPSPAKRIDNAVPSRRARRASGVAEQSPTRKATITAGRDAAGKARQRATSATSARRSLGPHGMLEHQHVRSSSPGLAEVHVVQIVNKALRCRAVRTALETDPVTHRCLAARKPHCAVSFGRTQRRVRRCS
jgi:hypothetical protein